MKLRETLMIPRVLIGTHRAPIKRFSGVSWFSSSRRDVISGGIGDGSFRLPVPRADDDGDDMRMSTRVALVTSQSAARTPPWKSSCRNRNVERKRNIFAEIRKRRFLLRVELVPSLSDRRDFPSRISNMRIYAKILSHAAYHRQYIFI